MFSVVVPSRGDARKLEGLLAALEAQTLPRERFEVVLVLDGVALPAALAPRLQALNARAVTLEQRRGPGAARNAGAKLARFEWLAFTEDDCVPRPDWLERAAARIAHAHSPAAHAIEGVTELPGGRPLRVRLEDSLQYLPTTLFVRRDWFERAGGYCERFFEPRRGIYFREDADLGFTLESLGAVAAREPSARVTHPEEHARFLDPLRWAARYEMDALLAARHPQRFRERIEVHRVGPLRFRRPIVRACVFATVAAIAAAVAFAFGQPGPGVIFAAAFVLLCVPIWAKWRFAPLRLPIVPLVPFAMSLALLRGLPRAARWKREAGPAQ
jgi:glycosyltransferase involved in cell wall biosynthesis